MSENFGICRVLLSALILWLPVVVHGESAGEEARYCNAERLSMSCPRSVCDLNRCKQYLERELLRVSKPSAGYEPACLCSGDNYYTDRYWRPTHRLSCVPEFLAGAVWIRTMNSDDGEEDPEHLEIELRAPARIYVAYDSRIVDAAMSTKSDESLPDWLTKGSGKFEHSELCLDIDEPDVSQEFVLFRKDYDGGSLEAAEKVVLGGNSARGFKYEGESVSNYLVAVVFDHDVALALDADGDGVSDPEDNCDAVANRKQADCDGDHLGDACDADYNNDGRIDMGDFAFFSTQLARSESGGAFDSCVDANGDGKLADEDLQFMMEALADESRGKPATLTRTE